MNNNIKKVLLLSLILIVASTIIVLVFGRTYTVSFNLNNKTDYIVSVDNIKGKVEIIDEKIVDDKYIIKVKGKEEGKVYIYFDMNDYTELKLLYVHKSKIITDNNFFGKSTGSEVIQISLCIIILYSIILLIKEYKKSLKENIYQYKNIAYLGIIIFLSFFAIDNVLSIYNYQGLFETINKIISTMTFISVIMLPIAIVTFSLVTLSNINLIIKEGKSLRNLLGLFLGIFIIALSLLPNYVYDYLMKVQIVDIYNLNSAGPYIYNCIESIVYLMIAYLECVLVGTIVIAIKSVRKKKDYNKDYIIILGCQIRKDGTLTPLLKGRVDKAIEYRNKQLELTGKDLIFIPSGGKGNDEVISEAEAMKNYLIEQGIDEKNIIVENKSKNTYENIKFSNKLIRRKNANVCFSTTNYHVLRAGLTASEQGLVLDGIGSKTKVYFWINAFIREFIGTLYAEKKKHILFFSLITLIIIVMIVITYFGNNI